MSKCCGRVFRNYHFTGCQNPGKVERYGKSYCGIHDPVAVKARDDKTKARWEIERLANEARYAANLAARNRSELCLAACEGLSDDCVRSMAIVRQEILTREKNES